MSDQEWGIDPLFWVEGDATVIRVRQSDGQIIETLQPKLLDIPGVYDNAPSYVVFSEDGMWYTTHSYDGGTPGIVYFAPYSTGEFRLVAQLPRRQEGRDFASHPIPGGLVVCEHGTRSVFILNQGGVVYQQELADGFIGDSYSWYELYLVDVVYRPSDGKIGLVFGLWHRDDKVLAVGLTELFRPGDPISWLAPLYTTRDESYEYASRGGIAAVAYAYGDGLVSPNIRTIGTAVASLGLSTPDAEVNPGLAVEWTYAYVAYQAEDVWPVTGVPAVQVMPVQIGYSRSEIDVRTLPIPRIYQYSIAIRIEPRNTDIISASLTIDGVQYETTVSHSTVGATTLYASSSGENHIFTPGQTHLVSMVLYRDGKASISSTRSLTAGSSDATESNPWSTGFRDGYNNQEYGSMSSSTLFQIDGTQYRARYIESTRRSSRWGGSAGIFARHYHQTPFWGSFVRTIEVGGEGGGARPTPTPMPDMYVVDFNMSAGYGWVTSEMLEVLTTGFDRAWSIGNTSPLIPVFGGVATAITKLNYSRSAVRVYLSALQGVDNAFVDWGDGPHEAIVSETTGVGTELLVPTPQSPFDPGGQYDVRVYLGGNLKGPALSDYRVYTADFELAAESSGPGDWTVGYTSYGLGSLTPDALDFGSRAFPIDSLAFERYGRGAVSIVVNNLVGATRWTMSVDGAPPLALSIYENAYGSSAAVVTPASIFADGGVYNVRLHIEGFLRDLEADGDYIGGGGADPAPDPGPDPDPEPSDKYVDFVLTAGSASAWGDVFIGYGHNWEEAYGTPMDDFGSIDPSVLVFGSLAIQLYDMSIATTGAAAGELYIALVGDYPVTNASVRVGGITIPLAVSDGASGTILSGQTTPNLFVDGQSYDVRLYLDGLAPDLAGGGVH